MTVSTRGWTYGAEFEMADWDRRRKLPDFVWGIDRDWTMVNSSGVAVDPGADIWHLGGEWLATPSPSPEDVARQLQWFMREYPEATVNYRCNLHVHVRVPGLQDDVDMLKRLQRFCHENLPTLLPIIDPIPEPKRSDYPEDDAWRGARKRYARRKISHHKMIAPSGYARQMQTRSAHKFLQAEALHPPTGRLLWATKPRCAVNLRQLLQTDTVEFRHFPGTTDPAEVRSAVKWCAAFLRVALDPVSWNPVTVDSLVRNYGPSSERRFPSFHPYVHWMEQRYHATSAHYVGREAALTEIARLVASGEVDTP